MSRSKLIRVRELGRDACVHFEKVGIQDAVTLCGRTDWLDDPRERGSNTSARVTCKACIDLVSIIQSAPRELFK